MKNFLFWTLMILTQSLYAGAVGGGGSSGILKRIDLMAVYSGANNLSKAAFGTENQFKLDFQNKIVQFNPDPKRSDQTESMSFEEVVRYADEDLGENLK